MFYGCSSLKELNLSNFNTEKVTDMRKMFYNCFSLADFISNFNFNNVNIIEGMLSGCSDEMKMKIRTQCNNLKDEAF